MANKAEIKQNYTQESLPFRSYKKFVHLPYLDVVLKNLSTGEIDQTTQRFKVDTGASVSIINKKYESFIKNIKPHDSIPIQYGNGKIQDCNVYEVGILIKGYEFKIPVVYDEHCSFLLLGHFGFLEYNTYNLFDSSLKVTRLIRT